MKTAFLSIIFSFLLISQSNAQALKIVDLEKMFKQSNENMDTFLAGKGFEFDETERKDDCEDLNYLLNISESEVEYLSKYSCTDGSILLSYNIFNTKAYSAIKQSLSANGFVFLEQETSDGRLIFHYKKAKLYLSLWSINVQRENGDSYIAYEINLKNEEFVN